MTFHFRLYLLECPKRPADSPQAGPARKYKNPFETLKLKLFEFLNKLKFPNIFKFLTWIHNESW